MAGIVGWVGSALELRREAFVAALASLRHEASFTSSVTAAERAVLLGATIRAGSRLDVSDRPELGVTVLVYGTAFEKDGGWRPAAAARIADSYLERGADTLCGREGSYVVAVVDRRVPCLEIVNDRIGSLPVVWARGDGWFAFAPEAKAVLPMLAARPRIDRDAAISFLSCGYPVGDRTMIESVRLLPPATLATVDLHVGEPKFRQYWRLAFNPVTGIDARDAARELTSRVVDAHRAVLSDTPSATAALLTGGMDSRAMLGTLAALGTLPDRAVTWAAVDGVPASDPVVASKIAAACAVPHAVLTYGAQTFADHARDWCRISELASDNMGDFAAGASFLSQALPPAAVVLIGDQMIGPGGLPLSRNHAVQQLTGVNPLGSAPGLSNIVKAACLGEAAASFRRQVDEVAAACPGPDPKDLHDFLYFHLYVRRWLMAPAYFREPMVTVRRPLLANSVVDFTATLPVWLRVDKRVLVDATRRTAPHLARIPRATADSLVDWGYETRRPGRLRDLLLDLLRFDRIVGTPIGTMVDADAYTRFVSAFFASPVQPMQRTTSLKARLLPVRRMASGSLLMTRLAARVEHAIRRAADRKPAGGAWAVVRRLALLALLQDVVDGSELTSTHADRAPSGAIPVRIGNP